MNKRIVLVPVVMLWCIGCETEKRSYGLRMDVDPGCEKGAEYVLKRLEDVYLPCALRYYGDPFDGKTPTRVFMLHVKRNDGTDSSKYTGPSWGCDSIDSFTVGLSKGSDKWEMDLSLLASHILTVCPESDSAAFSIYANYFIEGEINHFDPIPKIREDIRKGLEVASESEEKAKGRLWGLRRLAPIWAALEELRERHPTFILDYCNLKNSKYAKGQLPQEVSINQMAALLGEVTGEDVPAIFKRHNVAGVSATPWGRIAIAEKLGQCDFLLNKDFKKDAKVYLCLLSESRTGPCRAEMSRMAKVYTETLKDNPDIELVLFSRDQNDETTMAWAKGQGAKFPIVRPNGGNTLDLHGNKMPYLFIVTADGTLLEEGDSRRIFSAEKFEALKVGRVKPADVSANAVLGGKTAEVDGYTWLYTVKNGEAIIGAVVDDKFHSSRYRCAVSPNPIGHVSIPSTLEGVKVTGIGRAAFVSCREMTSVTIPSTVTRIGDCAFLWCRRLKSVTLPFGVTEIGRDAFQHCIEMKSVTLPQTLTRIGEGAFCGCRKLESIMIPSSVASIGRGAFNFCEELSEIGVTPDNIRYASVDGMLFTKDLKGLIACPGGASTVFVPASVTNICVTNVLANPFEACKQLTGIEVAQDNNAYSSVDGVLYSKDRTVLLSCPKGMSASVVMPSGVKRIADFAFWGCVELSDVTMQEEVMSIGKMSFYECQRLKSVTIPASTKTIGAEAFSSCGALTSIRMRGERPYLGDKAFRKCDNLKAIHVPASAKSWAGMKEWQGIPLVFDAE